MSVHYLSLKIEAIHSTLILEAIHLKEFHIREPVEQSGVVYRWWQVLCMEYQGSAGSNMLCIVSRWSVGSIHKRTHINSTRAAVNLQFQDGLILAVYKMF